eukprot:8589083-Pyramimonas_sp.AAC.1
MICDPPFWTPPADVSRPVALLIQTGGRRLAPGLGPELGPGAQLVPSSRDAPESAPKQAAPQTSVDSPGRLSTPTESPHCSLQ